MQFRPPRSWRVRAGLALAFGLAVGFATPAAAQRTLTGTLITAYNSSNLLEQNRATLRAADEDVAVAVAQLRPVLNFIAQSQYNSPVAPTADELTSTLALQADLTVYDFGRNRLAVAAAKEAVLATRAALVNVEQQVLLAAVEAHVEVRRAAEFVALRRNNVNVLQEQFDASEERFEVGEITQTDVALARSRLALARADLVSAQGDLEVARENYEQAVGVPPGNLAPLPPRPSTAASETAAKALGVRRHPLIDQARHQVAVADLTIDRQSRQRLGSVSGSASVNFDNEGRDSRSVGLSYQAPIYQGGALAAQTRRAVAQRDESRGNLLNTVRQIEAQVGTAWANVDVADARIDALAAQIRAARVAFRGIQEEAELGARTTLDVLDAEQELRDAQVQQIAAQATLYTATYNLMASMGLLTVEEIGLNVPTYDPAAYYNAVKDAPLASPEGERLDDVLRRLGR